MSEELELKDNLCNIKFACYNALPGTGVCVHAESKNKCKYTDDDYPMGCFCLIAQVQAISKYLKSIGIEFVLKGVDKPSDC